MNVEVSALCDAATDSQGKLNLLGTFDSIWAATLPARHPQCSVTVRLRFSRIEDGEHKITIHLVDEDGKLIVPPLDANLQVRFAEEEQTAVANLVLNIQGMNIEKYGEYSVNLAVDGRQEASLPLFVRKPKEQA